MGDQRPGYIGYCEEHGKRLYPSRKQAKQQLRTHRNNKGMREYPCDLVAGHFHIGHLPLVVVTGQMTGRRGLRGCPVNGLCFNQPPEYWDTGDEGNRLALALCRVCPLRDGDDCRAGLPDPRPAGVIRAGVAFNERRGRCDICDTCGYPVDDLPDSRRQREGCRHCRAPRLRSWDRTFTDRKTYFARYYQRRKKALAEAA